MNSSIVCLNSNCPILIVPPLSQGNKRMNNELSRVVYKVINSHFEGRQAAAVKDINHF